LRGARKSGRRQRRLREVDLTEGRDGGHEAVAARSDAIEPGAGVLLKDFGAYATATRAR